jgi:hypothetical protein
LLFHFKDIAFLVHGVPVFIGFAGFKLYGFLAEGAKWELRSRSKLRAVGHGVSEKIRLRVKAAKK